MQILSKSLKFFLAVLALGAIARAADEKPSAAVRTIVESEGRFGQMARERSVRAAFLEFLADDAIVFGPGPVNGKKVWSERKESGLELIWQPIFAAMARSSDLGYTTGPAKWKRNRTDEKFLGYGQFVSVWKKQRDGAWKVALDIGIENPQPTSEPGPPQTLAADDVPKDVDLVAARQALEKTQRGFAEMAKEDSLGALSTFASENIRAFREEMFPIIGKEAVVDIASAAHGPMSIQASGGEMSRSGDLAYSYGSYSIKRENETERGNLVQIWQTDSAGAWKVVLDLEQKVPAG
jgi:ketosteroid isomerase-like protein